jgi:hypothetical protein
VLRELVKRRGREPRLLDDLPPHQPCADPPGGDGRHDQQDQGAGTAVGPGEHSSLRDGAYGGAGISRR